MVEEHPDLEMRIFRPGVSIISSRAITVGHVADVNTGQVKVSWTQHLPPCALKLGMHALLFSQRRSLMAVQVPTTPEKAFWYLSL